MSFIDAVQRVGRKVQQKWPLADLSESAFAKIAQNALQDARLHERFDLDEIVQWVGQSSCLPRQRGVRNFAEPPLTLFDSPGFYIELYFWLQPKISIHDHGFTGSFTVLRGSSLQVKYRFDVTEDYGNAQMGTLDATAVEPMGSGDVSLIRPGPELIHQVWHLDQPTVSLVVRTECSLRVEQQRNYFSPGLAVANSRYSESATPRAEILTYLIRTGAEKNVDRIGRLFSGQDPTGAFYFLLQLERQTPDSNVTKTIRDHLRETFGVLGQRMIDIVEVDQLQRVIDFSKVVNADQRYMAALLLSALTREQIICSLFNRCGNAHVGRFVGRWLRGIIEALGENNIENDFAMEIVALAAEGLTYSEIQSAIVQKLQLDGLHQFEAYYTEVEKLAILRPVLPARPNQITS